VDKKPFKILAVAGSLRQASFNHGLLRAAKEVAPEWVEVRFFDIGQLPFFNEDVEAAGERPRAGPPVQGCHRHVKRRPDRHP
jgi:NAD(P)H-dependent FMN reductase